MNISCCKWCSWITFCSHTECPSPMSNINSHIAYKNTSCHILKYRHMKVNLYSIELVYEIESDWRARTVQTLCDPIWIWTMRTSYRGPYETFIDMVHMNHMIWFLKKHQMVWTNFWQKWAHLQYNNYGNIVAIFFYIFCKDSNIERLNHMTYGMPHTVYSRLYNPKSKYRCFPLRIFWSNSPYWLHFSKIPVFAQKLLARPGKSWAVSYSLTHR